MSLTQITTPSTTVSGETSKWNAVGNPVVYTMERRDYSFAAINDNSGFQQLQFTGVDIASSFSVDDILYCSSEAGNVTVTASVFSGGNTLVTTTAVYSSTASGYVNNLTTRPMYRVDVEVYDYTGDLLNSAAFSYTPNSAGLVTIDISRILWANMNPENDNDMVSNYYDDVNIYRRFYIKYTEVWTGSAESQTNDSSNEYYAIMGSRQVPSTYGGNMGEYVTFLDGVPKALFLTKFTTPVMWRGWPYLISLIRGSNVIRDVYLDVSGDESTHIASSSVVFNFNLNEIIVDDTVKTVDITGYNDHTTDVAMTDPLTVYLRDACEQPIMLMGRNSLGGVLMWMFDVNQEYTFDYGGGRKAKRLVLTAVNLTIDQWEALQDFITLGEVYRDNIVTFSSSVIKTSTRIGQQVYVVEQDGTKTGVIVIPTRNSTMTKARKHIFEIEIEYPEQL